MGDRQNDRPRAPHSPLLMLEIAEQWLREGAFALTKVGQNETADQLSRVAHQCRVTIKSNGDGE